MRVYLSHSIRGKYGKDATEEQMRQNCNVIKQLVEQIKDRLRLNGLFHEVEIYLPAEHEDFVSICYREKYLDEKQILAVDCKIIEETCEAVLAYCPKDDPINGGRKIELDFSRSKNILTCQFEYIGEAMEFIKYVYRGKVR